MWPFKRKKESAKDSGARDYPDDEIRQVAWDEFDKEARLRPPRIGTVLLGPLATPGAAAELLNRDSDPADEHGQRQAGRDEDEKT
jgi:hypothetical protein